MAKRIKTEAAAGPVPQSREEAAGFIAEIGRLQRERERIKAAMNDRLAELKQEHEESARVPAERIRELAAGVQIWAEANRLELTRRGQVKSARLASGEIKWRTRPPRVNLRGVEGVIAACRKLGLDRFVRVKEEVNKEAMLAEPDLAGTIAGVSITQGEDFVIVPFETDLEEVA